MADTLPVGARIIVTTPYVKERKAIFEKPWFYRFFGGVERAATNVARLDAIERRRRERLV